MGACCRSGVLIINLNKPSSALINHHPNTYYLPAYSPLCSLLFRLLYTK